MCKLFPAICKPHNLGDSEEFSKTLSGHTLDLCTDYVPPNSWFNQLMSLFGSDQVYTCLEKVYMVYTGLPPDEKWDL